MEEAYSNQFVCQIVCLSVTASRADALWARHRLSLLHLFSEIVWRFRDVIFPLSACVITKLVISLVYLRFTENCLRILASEVTYNVLSWTWVLPTHTPIDIAAVSLSIAEVSVTSADHRMSCNGCPWNTLWCLYLCNYQVTVTSCSLRATVCYNFNALRCTKFHKEYNFDFRRLCKG